MELITGREWQRKGTLDAHPGCLLLCLPIGGNRFREVQSSKLYIKDGVNVEQPTDFYKDWSQPTILKRLLRKIFVWRFISKLL